MGIGTLDRAPSLLSCVEVALGPCTDARRNCTCETLRSLCRYISGPPCCQCSSNSYPGRYRLARVRMCAGVLVADGGVPSGVPSGSDLGCSLGCSSAAKFCDVADVSA